MVSINLILNKYENCENYICCQGNRIPKFNSIINGIEIQYLKDDIKLKEIVTYFLKKNFNCFFFFHSSSYSDVYIAYRLHRQGCKIALVEDGMAPYTKWKRSAWLTIKQTYIFYRKGLNSGVFLPYLYLRTMQGFGGGLHFLNELWLRFPESLPLQDERYRRLPDFSPSVIKLFKEMYHFDFTLDTNIILFIGQPLVGRIDKEPLFLRNEEFILNEIKRCKHDAKLIYKCHPLCSMAQIDSVKQNKNIDEVILDKIPVELWILSLRNSYVMSFCSTGTLTNNKSCKFFWLYKLLPKEVSYSINKDIINPTSHISVIESFDSLLKDYDDARKNKKIIE